MPIQTLFRLLETLKRNTAVKKFCFIGYFCLTSLRVWLLLVYVWQGSLLPASSYDCQSGSAVLSNTGRNPIPLIALFAKLSYVKRTCTSDVLLHCHNPTHFFNFPPLYMHLNLSYSSELQPNLKIKRKPQKECMRELLSQLVDWHSSVAAGLYCTAQVITDE